MILQRFYWNCIRRRRFLNNISISIMMNEREHKMSHNDMKNKSLREIFSYFMVSFSQTFVEFGAFALLQILALPAPVPSAGSVFVSGCWNYMLNRNITFKSSANYARSITLFVLLYCWNFVYLNLMLSALSWDPMVIKLFTMGCQGVWGFLACKFIIFR